MFDLCTNPQYGVGMPVDAIGDRSQYSAYCRAMGLLLSPALSAQEQAISVLQRWAQITNTWIFWSENRMKFVPLGDTAVVTTGNGPIVGSELRSAGANYSAGDTGTITTGTGDATWRIVRVSEDASTTPGTPPLGSVIEYAIDDPGTSYNAFTGAEMAGGSGSGFTIDIFVPGPASFTPNMAPIYDLTWRTSSAPATMFRSRSRAATRPTPAIGSRSTSPTAARNTTPARWSSKIRTASSLYGLMQAQSVQAREICERSIGSKVAAILGKRAVYIRNTYTFKLGYNFLLLKTGDLVTLTDPAMGWTASRCASSRSRRTHRACCRSRPRKLRPASAPRQSSTPRAGPASRHPRLMSGRVG